MEYDDRNYKCIAGIACITQLGAILKIVYQSHYRNNFGENHINDFELNNFRLTSESYLQYADYVLFVLGGCYANNDKRRILLITEPNHFEYMIKVKEIFRAYNIKFNNINTIDEFNDFKDFIESKIQGTLYDGCELIY